MHIKADILENMENNTKHLKYIYFDFKANIQIYLIINNVII